VDQREVEGRLLVVNLKSDAQQVAQIVGILQRLEIAADVLTPPAPTREPGTLVLRVTHDRMVEAVLALSYHGFADVKAYEAERP
jgi:hypothetical protein